MLAKRAFAFLMATIVVLTMSCCATLQASVFHIPSTTTHACCDKDKDKDKKKDGEKQHNCQCGEKLTQFSAKAPTLDHNLVAAELPAVVLFEIAPVSVDTSSTSLIADSPPPPTPALRYLHCLYLI